MASLLTPHSSLLTPHSSLLWQGLESETLEFYQTGALTSHLRLEFLKKSTDNTHSTTGYQQTARLSLELSDDLVRLTDIETLWTWGAELPLDKTPLRAEWSKSFLAGQFFSVTDEIKKNNFPLSLFRPEERWLGLILSIAQLQLLTRLF